MMVTFISQCEKNALKKTRRVLDAFADRIGDNTWQTIITQDGLNAVKKLLRKTATKSTAVTGFGHGRAVNWFGWWGKKKSLTLEVLCQSILPNHLPASMLTSTTGRPSISYLMQPRLPDCSMISAKPILSSRTKLIQIKKHPTLNLIAMNGFLSGFFRPSWRIRVTINGLKS